MQRLGRGRWSRRTSLPARLQHRSQRRQVGLSSGLALWRSRLCGFRGAACWRGCLRRVRPTHRDGDSSTTRPETMSPGLCSAMYSSMLVGIKLLHGELDLALFRIDAKDLSFDHLTVAQHVARMVDAAVRRDLADVHEAVDAFSDLNECAEVHDLGDGAFDLRADGKSLRYCRATDRRGSA